MRIAITSENSSRLLEKRYIAARSGFSSTTTSMNSPPVDAGPMMRIDLVAALSIISKALLMAVPIIIVRMSMSRSTPAAFGARQQAALLAHLDRHRARADAVEDLPRQRSGTMPLGAASSTSAAVLAAASRSFSRF